MKNIKLWMITLVFVFSSYGFARPVRSFKVKGPVKALCFAPDLSLCAVAREIDQESAQVEIWDMRKGRLMHKLSRIVYPYHMTFSANSRCLAVNGHGFNHLQVWNPRTGKLRRTLRNQAENWHDYIAISPTGRYVAGGGSEQGTWLWEVKTGKILGCREPFFPGPIAFSPNEKNYFVLSHYNRREMTIQDVISGKVYRELGRSDAMQTAMFSPDGKIIAMAGYMPARNPAIKYEERLGFALWNVATGKKIYARTWVPTEQNWDSLFAISFSQDGALFATASDRTFRIWQTKTGKLVKVLDKRKVPVRAVSFSSKENLLATASSDGIVNLWRVP